MSRIGNKPIEIPAGVEVKIDGQVVTVKGAKGELVYNVHPLISVEVEGTTIVCKRPNDEKQTKALHGTTRANLHNNVVGVSQGFEKILEIVGVGYKAQMTGNTLVVSAGYAHTCDFPIPEGLTVTCATPTEIHISGCDKQLVGELAAEVRKVRKPEPYKGKGIHYRGEFIRRKEGKKAK